LKFSFSRKKTSTVSTGGSSADKNASAAALKNRSGGINAMARKEESMNNTSAPGDVKAILGKGSEFEGKLRFEGTVRIDGRFKGEVSSSGTLIVGEQANIEGDLEVDTAIISGQVQGNVKAKSRIELHSPAKVAGDVKAPVLVVQEGVTFDGNCQMSGLEGSKNQQSAGGENKKGVWGAEQTIPAKRE